MHKLENIDDSNVHYGFYAKYVKRILDFVISLTALILLSPIFIILCVLVRIKLGTPIFFKQVRAGLDEKPFEMIKFRTMINARDDNGQLLPDTERFTKYGDFLRNYSLDELPELINVIKGDMSIVGPRPLYTFYLPYYTEEESLRHAVRGGITGLAQVNGRALCRWNERFAYDVKYVKTITFLNDLKILWLTVYKVLKKSDIGIPSVTDEGGLHIVRDVQRPYKVKEIGSAFSGHITSDESANYPTFVSQRGGGSNIVFLSSGRSCIKEVISSLDDEKKIAIIPSFTCESVVVPFLDAGYDIYPYGLKENLEIDCDTLCNLLESVKPSVLLFHRYFGYDTCKNLYTVIRKYKNDGLIVIEDETQYMFSDKRDYEADYYIGSIRKWGSFPDGAYIMSERPILKQPVNEDKEFVDIEVRAMNIKQDYLDGTAKDQSYQDMFAHGRKYLDEQKNTFSISTISNNVLEKTDIDEIIQVRRRNAICLIEGLKNYSWLEPIFDSVPDNVTPFMIPILVHDGRKEFQQYLASSKIYATVIWSCPDYISTRIDEISIRIYNEILCLPCDQRYTVTDMERVINCIRRYDEKRTMKYGEQSLSYIGN